MARSADFDLAAALRSPSFTPAERDATALVELVLAGDERAPAVLAKLGGARATLAARLDEPDDARRMRLVGALGLIARRGDAPAIELVIARLGDPSSRVRRAAIGALGNLGGELARAAIATRWDAADVTPDERRALADALGKLGGDDALGKLRALDPGGDAELARRRDRALLVADRSGKRGEDSSVRDDVAPRSSLTVVLHCKRGLARLLADELRAGTVIASPATAGRAAAPEAVRSTIDDASVELALAGPWRGLWRSRLWLDAGIRVPRPALADPAESIARGIVDAAPLLAAWTTGPIRWRLDVGSGKQRAVIWRVAKLVAAAAPALVNDPTETTWDVIVRDASLELQPRRITDPRFAYRVADVPAASHPTVAAALAFAAGARQGDRVWDPFVGSALELIERSRLGPVRSLAGTDLSEGALAAARANLAAAGVTATLELGDARAVLGERDLELVITNPPLGGRVQVDAPALLAQLLPIVARRLVAGGRLVWIVPAHAAAHLGKLADKLALRRTLFVPDVDLGGVRVCLERRELS
ncbi:MAG TPA: HEAT repeat domain-containing protein [Kofleriaceae bacterium]|jgi:hypothetical protein